MIIENIKIDGIQSEIIYSKKPGKSIKNYIFIIPGNPGIAPYYIEFMEKLGEKIIDSSIITLGYAGFTKENLNQAFTISDEYLHKKNLILELSKSIPKNAKITIIGHSIGSWITIEILKEFLIKNIKIYTILLFPFIVLDKKSWSHSFIRFLLKFHSLIVIFNFFYKTIIKFPKKIKNLISSNILKGMSEEAKNITLEYFFNSNHILYSLLFMAESEFNIIKYELDMSISEKLNSSYFLFNTNDFWAPLSSWKLIQEKFPDIRGNVLEGKLHDFCVHTNGNRIISNEIIRILKEEFKLM